MRTAASFPVDTLAALVNADTQRLAARMAQDIFTEVFRQSAASEPVQLAQAMTEIESQCHNWCRAGEGEAVPALRLALLVAGLDQWGLAYSQAFNLTALPALTALLGALRGRLDARGDTLFQQYFRQIEQNEGDAIDFKIELRRGIHLALWHAMTACETTAQAQAILKPLGGMMLALDRQMPELGWRLLADALANIQVALLGELTAASEVARESTQQLFESLQHALPKARYQSMLAYSGQAVLAWQQARRAQSVGTGGVA